MLSKNTIVRDRQLVIRREMDRRGISLKAVSFDSGIPYATIVSYFPGERDREPATLSIAAIFMLCETNALPLDLVSLLLPEGFQIVRAPEDLDHQVFGDLTSRYLAAKNRAHHPNSEAGVDIGPNERANLTSIVVELKAA